MTGRVFPQGSSEPSDVDYVRLPRCTVYRRTGRLWESVNTRRRYSWSVINAGPPPLTEVADAKGTPMNPFTDDPEYPTMEINAAGVHIDLAGFARLGFLIDAHEVYATVRGERLHTGMTREQMHEFAQRLLDATAEPETEDVEILVLTDETDDRVRTWIARPGNDSWNAVDPDDVTPERLRLELSVMGETFADLLRDHGVQSIHRTVVTVAR